MFHAAGTVRRDALWRSHVDSTVCLLDAVRALPDPASVRIVIPGSSAEYGLAGGDGGPRSPRTRETDPAEPITPYGVSKLAQTLIALSYRHRGLDVRVGRIFNILGPGMPETLSLGSFARQIARIERGLQTPRLTVGRLSAERDYVHVADVARALCLIASRGRSGEAYNVCSGRLHSMRELLDAMLAFATRRIAVVQDPVRMRGPEVRRIAGDGRKLAAATGWRPRIAVDAALRETLDWHRRALPAAAA